MVIDYDRHLELESDRFLHAVRATHPDRVVPTCPDWSAADLLWHLAEVQHFWADIVAHRRQRPGETVPGRPESFAELEQFFVDSHRHLMETLAAIDDGETVWTWYEPDRTVGFVRRRQTHEALIHRLDAEATAGRDWTDAPIDAELATDGVDEALTCMFSGAPAWARTLPYGPVGRLRTTDTNREWLVQVGHFEGTSPESGKSYVDEPMLMIVTPDDPAPADCGPDAPSFDISAPASDLVAWIWNRPTRTEVSRRGDTTAIESLFAIGVQ